MIEQCVNAEQAAQRATELAEQALAFGTFGVEALLIDKGGRVLREERNRVIENGIVVDPIGHAERRLIDWFFEQRRAGRRLPNPAECTIVSSLDPCIHCAGAMLAAGFNCLWIAEDSTAGVSYFACLPSPLKSEARHSIRPYGLKEESRLVELTKEDTVPTPTISRKLADRALAAFEASQSRVQQVFAIDKPRKSAPAIPARLEFGDDGSLFGKLNLTHLLQYMSNYMRRTIGVAAFVSFEDNFMLVAVDHTDRSPARVALAELVRKAYAANSGRINIS